MPGETPIGASTFVLESQLATEGRWLLCRANSTHRRLVDLLNANLDRALTVQIDAYAAGTDEVPAADGPAGTLGSVNTRAILFGIPIEAAEMAPARRSPGWIEKDKRRVRIGIGRYEIVGNVHLPKGIERVEDAVSEITGFFAVTEATTRRAGGLPVPERVVIVNSSRMDFIRCEPVGYEVALSLKSTVAVGTNARNGEVKSDRGSPGGMTIVSIPASWT